MVPVAFEAYGSSSVPAVSVTPFTKTVHVVRVVRVRAMKVGTADRSGTMAEDTTEPPMPSYIPTVSDVPERASDTARVVAPSV